MDSLDKIADIMIRYYRPVGMIEAKYRTKVTAVGLLKSARMNTPNYLEPYYQRLFSYKELVKDHTENLKMAGITAVKIFGAMIFKIVEKNLSAGTHEDFLALSYLITLLYPKYNNAGEKTFHSLHKQFLSKYNSQAAIHKVAHHVLSHHLNESEQYDKLGDTIIQKCLTGVTQEDVLRRINNAVFNFFVYGLYSRAEAAEIYNITMKTRNTVIPLKYFTKIQSMARTIINKVINSKATINFFGNRWDSMEVIDNLFRKYSNITLMFY